MWKFSELQARHVPSGTSAKGFNGTPGYIPKPPIARLSGSLELNHWCHETRLHLHGNLNCLQFLSYSLYYTSSASSE